MKFLITGGAGFIGSALVRFLIRETDHEVLNLDKLTYASNLTSLASVSANPRYRFQQLDIVDAPAVSAAIELFEPDRIIHLAAETHVDRSVDSPAEFIQTNIVGSYTLLNAACHYWQQHEKADFLFHHVSSDEVFGSLGTTGYFTEETPYAPNSPYSASKASSDHLVRAWGTTYGMPAVITNCANNYGPYQYPEKLISLMIMNALAGKPRPVYGQGDNVRDWLHVEDHVRALYLVATKGVPGETYNIGGHCEKTNLEVIEILCDTLETLNASAVWPFRELITFVKDRPGHDQRYAIDASKIECELGWKPAETFESGIRKTVEWYVDNQDWCRSVSRQDSRL